MYAAKAFATTNHGRSLSIFFRCFARHPHNAIKSHEFSFPCSIELLYLCNHGHIWRACNFLVPGSALVLLFHCNSVVKTVI